MRVQALLEPRQMAWRVVRRIDRAVAKDPEERGLLGMLLDDAGKRCRAGRKDIS